MTLFPSSGTLFTSTSDFVYIEGLGYQVNRHLAHAEFCVRKMCTTEWRQKNTALDLQGLRCGGDSWTRTNDPIDVNDVLYRLSHATTLRFEVPTKVSYQLSHATMCFPTKVPVGTTD